MEDPIKEKLEDIHRDLKGGFDTVHTRMDREGEDRSYWSGRVVEMWQKPNSTSPSRASNAQLIGNALGDIGAKF